MFQATRRRLALWYACATGLLLVLFAAGFFWYVRWTLIDRIDDTIAHVAEVLPPPHHWTSTAIQSQFSSRADDLEADRIDLEWYSASGELLWTTLPAGAVVPFQAQNNLFRTVYPEQGEPLRQLTIPVGKPPVGYVRISHPWFEVTKPIQQLFWDLCIGTMAVVLAVGLSSWWLSGIAIQPVLSAYEKLKQFTADASHELRNPIAAIQTNVQVLLSEFPEHPQLLIIERLTRRLGQLVEDLLFLARQDSHMPIAWQTHSLGKILQIVIEEQQAIAQEKNITVLTKGLDTEVQVQGDHSQLVRLFTNLIANAINFTPSGGQILICQEKNKVTVQDTGCGIELQHLPYIFERFYRSQPQTKGAGLGLAIVKAICDRHHAQITVQSQVGQGTSFTITFPSA